MFDDIPKKKKDQSRIVLLKGSKKEHKQFGIVNIFSEKFYLYIETLSKHENNDT